MPPQVVHLLEVASLSLTLITTAYDDQHMMLPDIALAPGHLTFAPDSQHIVVAWTSDDGTCGCDIHNRQGHRVAQYELGAVRYGAVTPPAFARDNRVAFACGNSLVVWDLLSGQHLGTWQPLNDTAPEGSLENNGVVAANKTGSKLAFVAAHACDLYLYNAVTLARLGSVCVCMEGCTSDAAVRLPSSMGSMAGSCSTMASAQRVHACSLSGLCRAAASHASTFHGASHALVHAFPCQPQARTVLSWLFSALRTPPSV